MTRSRHSLHRITPSSWALPSSPYLLASSAVRDRSKLCIPHCVLVLVLVLIFAVPVLSPHHFGVDSSLVRLPASPHRSPDNVPTVLRGRLQPGSSNLKDTPTSSPPSSSPQAPDRTIEIRLDRLAAHLGAHIRRPPRLAALSNTPAPHHSQRPAPVPVTPQSRCHQSMCNALTATLYPHLRW